MTNLTKSGLGVDPPEVPRGPVPMVLYLESRGIGPNLETLVSNHHLPL